MVEKPERIAVALSYDASADDAPRVVATGTGWVAEQIIALAQKYNIPINKNTPLADLLRSLELDATIPMEAYLAVANILSYIYKQDAMEGKTA
jgi:flagellar biosynthesis protein